MNFENLLLCLYRIRNFKGSSLEKREAFFVLRRLKEREFKKNKKNELIKASFLNYKVFAYDHWSLHYLFSEIFIDNEYFFEAQSSEPLIIDCGANIGMSILYFKRMYPDSRIVAFEPNPNAFSLLQKNIKENNLINVTTFNLGLSDNDDKIPFYYDNSNKGTLIGSLNKERGGHHEMLVSTKKLSSFIKEYGKVDLVKMDVEGAKIQIFKELYFSGVMRNVKEFIVEYHHNLKGETSNLSGFLGLFEKEGYSYNIKARYSNLRSFQDVLIHFYQND